jgi:diguanylate cyclase (GGDEF)-like protein
MLSYKKVIIHPLIFASLLLTAAMVWIFFAMYSLVDLSHKKDLVDMQRYRIVALSNAITDAESGQRGYLITNNVTFLDTYDDGKMAAEKYFEQLFSLDNKFPEISPIILEVKNLMESKFDLMNKGIQVQMRAGSYASHLTLQKDRSKLIMSKIKAELANADALLYDKRQQYEKGIKQKIEASIIGGVVLVISIYAILVRSYKRTLGLFERVVEGQLEVNRLSHQATHDSLTGVPNRRAFDVHLRKMHAKARRASKKYAVLFMDLDGFKEINDTYGHTVGDKLLVQVTKQFLYVIREYDFIARLGGDEFALVVDYFETKQELEQLALRIIDILEPPILIEGKKIKIGVSIGIAIYPEDAKDIVSLLGIADSAMYLAKKSGRNQYSFRDA